MKKLITDINGNPSSKRLTGFVALALIIAFSITSLCGIEIDINVFYALSALAGGAGISTLFEKKNQ